MGYKYVRSTFGSRHLQHRPLEARSPKGGREGITNIREPCYTSTNILTYTSSSILIFEYTGISDIQEH